MLDLMYNRQTIVQSPTISSAQSSSEACILSMSMGMCLQWVQHRLFPLENIRWLTILMIMYPICSIDTHMSNICEKPKGISKCSHKLPLYKSVS